MSARDEAKEEAKARVRAKRDAVKAMPAVERIEYLLHATHTAADTQALLAEVRAVVLDEAADDLENLLAEYESDATTVTEFCRNLAALRDRWHSPATAPEPLCHCGHPADVHGEQCSLCTGDGWFHSYTPAGGDRS